MKTISEDNLRIYPKTTAQQRIIAFCAALILCFTCCVAQAETAEFIQPTEETASDNAVQSNMDSADGQDFQMLTGDSFNANDVPESYLTESENPGHVEKMYYSTVEIASDGSATKAVKSVMVYFPAGYEESDRSYNVLYLLHGANGAPKNYLNPDRPTKFQCLLDHLIENGDIEPMIVIAATYFPSDGSAQQLPLAQQVEVVASFPQELVTSIIPQIEEKCRTYGASASLEDIAASRDHRAIAGFSLGAVATWYVFQQQMQAFKWFLPISEAGWDDGQGGISGILDSDVSAQALYDAVKEQGYSAEDFQLFVATGSQDEAFDITTNQIKSLLKFSDLFKLGKNTSCAMMIDGKHTFSSLYTYFYHMLPSMAQTSKSA